MESGKGKFTLDRSATYEIKVPGELGPRWSGWAGGIAIAVETEGNAPPVTTLTAEVDQAALQSLLRRLKDAGAIERTTIVASSLRVERTTELLRFGVRDVVLKPYTLVALSEIVG